jgi:DHA2 family multidrug resistance protein
MMQQHGQGPVAAVKGSYAMLEGILQRQAAILSYIDVFMILCGVFLGILPLIFIMKRPPKGGEPVAAH